MAQALGELPFQPNAAGTWRLRLVLEQNGIAPLENVYDLVVI
jgi:hypothetical protein